MVWGRRFSSFKLFVFMIWNRPWGTNRRSLCGDTDHSQRSWEEKKEGLCGLVRHELKHVISTNTVWLRDWGSRRYTVCVCVYVSIECSIGGVGASTMTFLRKHNMNTQKLFFNWLRDNLHAHASLSNAELPWFCIYQALDVTGVIFEHACAHSSGALCSPSQ